jgi:hypothetical protein
MACDLLILHKLYFANQPSADFYDTFMGFCFSKAIVQLQSCMTSVCFFIKKWIILDKAKGFEFISPMFSHQIKNNVSLISEGAK